MSKKAKELAARYGKKSDIIEIVKEIIEEKKHINAFANPDCAIITPDDEIQVYKWGLIPHWVKDEAQAADIRKMTYNAKAETIFDKPSFREPIKSKRCLIPSTGFYEWRHEGKNKIPYFIRLKDEEIFSLAGIYDTWHDRQTGEIVTTFSILTTEANEMMSYIHNTKKRMPVIISQERESAWLKSNLSKDEINSFFVPFEDGRMEAKVIDKKILNCLTNKCLGLLSHKFIHIKIIFFLIQISIIAIH